MTIVDSLFDFRDDVIRFGRKKAVSKLKNKFAGSSHSVINTITECVDSHGLFITRDGPTIISKKYPQFSSRKLPK